MGLLDAIKTVAKSFFSEYDPNNRILARVKFYTRGVSLGLTNEEPRLLANFLFEDPKMIEKYGLHLQIESAKFYHTLQTGDRLTLWLEENPDYDGKHPETRLRLADNPR